MVETAQCEGMVEVEAARYEQTLPTPSPSIRPVKTAGTQRVKWLELRARDGGGRGCKCYRLCHAKPETMSIVVNKNNNHKQDYVKIIDPPQTLRHGDAITVAYRCQGAGKVGVEIRVWTTNLEDAMPFRKTWTCGDHAMTELRKSVAVNLPDKLAYKPSRANPFSVIVEKCVIFGWILEPTVWEKRLPTMFHYALAHVKESTKMSAPYKRPDKPITVCYNWWKEMKMAKPYAPKCAVQPDIFKAVTHPVALSGTGHGVHTVVPEYSNKVLKRKRMDSFHKAKFSIVLWLYILEYCPESSRPLCSIMQRLSWDDHYLTPLVFVNKNGFIHIQVNNAKGATHAFLTAFALPKEQWCRLVVTFHKNRWDVYLNGESNYDYLQHTYYMVPRSFDVFHNDVQGLYVFGGSEMVPAFKGYIGEATVYRNKIIKVEKLKMPSPYHPMFELGVSARQSKCEAFLTWVKFRIYTANILMQDIIKKHSCSNELSNIFRIPSPKTGPMCAPYRGPKTEETRVVSRLVRRLVRNNQQVELEDIGSQIYNRAVESMEEDGFSSVTSVVQLLKQASCYGNHDATFMLSAILSNGVAVKAQEAMSHLYLMHGALDNNRLCLLALGNKHTYGLDGLPHSFEHAYVYYKNVADRTRMDREEHKEDDLLTEMVRLTDEAALNDQTDEEGDLFNWFKHQASNGVLSAQKDMARLLFWGSQGIKRNLQAAAEYYRMGAESNDPVALHDLGIVLLKGQGVEKNETEAKIHLSKAADLGNSGALNALGWHALEKEKNYTLAMGYFERSYKKGNADAAHNLGHMWMTAHTQERKVDRVKAFKYFEFAAVRGQMDSGLMIALYNMRGHVSVTRSPALAVQWARFIAEKNPAVGRMLSRALKAYRKHNGPAALLYYLIAAETGAEVANFNVAYLCEDNQDGVVHHLEKECTWRHYNLTTMRGEHEVNPYAMIKMGDYYWYACQGNKDAKKAAALYSDAAAKGDPQAIFNLAFMVEEGVHIEPKTWKKLRIPKAQQANNVTLLTALYSKCKESRKSEAYFPCLIAMYRVQLYDIWEKHHILVKLSTFAGVVLTVAVTTTSIYQYFRGNHLLIDSV